MVRGANTLPLLFVLALSSAPQSHAQVELIEVERPCHAHHLAGIVLDPTGEPVAGVRVDVCKPPATSGVLRWDCDPEQALESTTTDSKGHFEFPKANRGRRHYLNFSFPGFDPSQIRVSFS